MINIYKVTYILVCGDDGLISHTIDSIKEIMPPDINKGVEEVEEEEEEEEETNGK